MVQRIFSLIAAGMAIGLLACQQQQMGEETRVTEEVNPYAERTISFQPSQGVSEACGDFVESPKLVRICFDYLRTGGEVTFSPKPASELGPFPDDVSPGQWGFTLVVDDTLSYSGLIRVTVNSKWAVSDSTTFDLWQKREWRQRLFYRHADADVFQDITIASKIQSPAELDGGWNRPSDYVPVLDRRDGEGRVIPLKRQRLAEAITAWRRKGGSQDLAGVVATAQTLWFSQQMEARSSESKP